MHVFINHSTLAATCKCYCKCEFKNFFKNSHASSSQWTIYYIL